MSLFTVISRRDDDRVFYAGCWHAAVEIDGTTYWVGTSRERRGDGKKRKLVTTGYVRRGADSLLGENGRGRYPTVKPDVTVADLLKLAGITTTEKP